MSQNLTNEKLTLVQVMFVAIRQQAIIWPNNDPDICHHMATIGHNGLTHLPWVLHICVNRVGIDSDNGLLLLRQKAIIWTSVG